METKVVLGLARLGDAPRIAALSRAVVEEGLPWTWTPRRVAAHMKQRENLAVLARAGGELAGFVLAQFGSRDVHISLLAVATAYQRAGLGRRLMQWVEESAVTAGLFDIKLEVRETNTNGRRFYRALGYVEVARTARYYSGVEDAIQFTRDLRVQR